MCADRVGIFQASLKLVRAKARVQFSSKDNKCLTSHTSKYLHEGDAVNKNDTLIWR